MTSTNRPSSANNRSNRRSRGFSLLEMIVAIAILALALGSLYQAASGATRNVRTAERYAYGVELARSLLANHSRVPEAGVEDSGETAGGYLWRVSSAAVDQDRAEPAKANMHAIEVGVGWYDGAKRREIVLNSVVEVYRQ